MNSRIIIVFLLFFILKVKAQVENIELPPGNEKITINRTTPAFSIYIDKNNSVYFEKQPIDINDLGKKLTYEVYKIPEEYKMSAKVFLYIDKNTSYKTVDKVKTEIATASLYNIYYKTNSIDDHNILSGIYWRNHRSFFHISKIEKQLTKKQEKEFKIKDSLAALKKKNTGLGIIPPPPPPPPLHWSADYIFRLYSGQKDIVNEALEEREYTCVMIKNSGIETESGHFTFNETNMISDWLSEKKVVFIKFQENLTYTNYFVAINHFKTLSKAKSPLFVELSKEISDIYKDIEISLCN